MLSPMRSGSGLFCAVKRGLGGFVSPQSAPVFPRLAAARPAGKRRASVIRLYNTSHLQYMYTCSCNFCAASSNRIPYIVGLDVAESSGVTSDLPTNQEPVPQTDVASDDTSDDIDVEEPPPPETDILP